MVAIDPLSRPRAHDCQRDHRSFFAPCSQSCYNPVTVKPSVSHNRQNLRALMRRRLPAKILTRLKEIGRLADATDVSAYLVGGLVRDSLLGRKNLDVDIAVEGDGMTSARRLPDQHAAGLKIFDRFATSLAVFPDVSKLAVS